MIITRDPLIAFFRANGIDPDDVIATAEAKAAPRPCNLSLFAAADPAAAGTTQGTDVSTTHKQVVTQYNVVAQWCAEVAAAPDLSTLVSYDSQWSDIAIATCQGYVTAIKSQAATWTPVASDMQAASSAIKTCAKAWGDIDAADSGTLAYWSDQKARVLADPKSSASDKSAALTELRKYLGLFNSYVQIGSTTATTADSTIKTWQTGLTAQETNFQTIGDNLKKLIQHLNALEQSEQADYDAVAAKYSRLAHALPYCIAAAGVGVLATAALMASPLAPEAAVVMGLLTLGMELADAGMEIAMAVYAAKMSADETKIHTTQVDLGNAMRTRSAMAMIQIDSTTVDQYISAHVTGLDNLVTDYQKLIDYSNTVSLSDTSKLVASVAGLNNYWKVLVQDSGSIADIDGQYALDNGSPVTVAVSDWQPRTGEDATTWHDRVQSVVQSQQQGLAQRRMLDVRMGSAIRRRVATPLAVAAAPPLRAAAIPTTNLIDAINDAMYSLARLPDPVPSNPALQKLATCITAIKAATMEWKTENVAVLSNAYVAVIQGYQAYQSFSQWAADRDYSFPTDPDDAEWIILQASVNSALSSVNAAQTAMSAAKDVTTKFSDNMENAFSNLQTISAEITTDEQKLTQEIQDLKNQIADAQSRIDKARATRRSWWMIMLDVVSMGTADAIAQLAMNEQGAKDDLATAQAQLQADSNSFQIYKDAFPMTQAANDLLGIVQDCMVGFFSTTGTVQTGLDELVPQLQTTNDPTLMKLQVQLMDISGAQIGQVIQNLHKINLSSLPPPEAAYLAAPAPPPRRRAPTFTTYLAHDGTHRFELADATGRVVGSSPGFASHAECLEAIRNMTATMSPAVTAGVHEVAAGR